MYATQRPMPLFQDQMLQLSTEHWNKNRFKVRVINLVVGPVFAVLACLHSTGTLIYKVLCIVPFIPLRILGKLSDEQKKELSFVSLLKEAGMCVAYVVDIVALPLVGGILSPKWSYRMHLCLGLAVQEDEEEEEWEEDDTITALQAEIQAFIQANEKLTKEKGILLQENAALKTQIQNPTPRGSEKRPREVVPTTIIITNPSGQSSQNSFVTPAKTENLGVPDAPPLRLSSSPKKRRRKGRSANKTRTPSNNNQQAEIEEQQNKKAALEAQRRAELETQRRKDALDNELKKRLVLRRRTIVGSGSNESTEKKKTSNDGSKGKSGPVSDLTMKFPSGLSEQRDFPPLTRDAR